MAQLEINISDRAYVTNVTYQTSAQSKITVKIQASPQLCTRLVSRICHAGAVANVDFKLCNSLADGNKVRRKAESSSSEAKIV